MEIMKQIEGGILLMKNPLKNALARSNKNTESEPHPIPLEVFNSDI